MHNATFTLSRLASHEDFAAAYQLMTAGDRHHQMLYEDASFSTWLRLAADEDAWSYFVLANGVPVACIVINGHCGRAAFIHFCGFKGYEYYAHACGRYVLEWLIPAHKSCLIGVTPSTYRHVLRYIKSVGLKEQCVVPDACYIKEKQRHVNSVICMVTHKDLEEDHA